MCAEANGIVGSSASGARKPAGPNASAHAGGDGKSVTGAPARGGGAVKATTGSTAWHRTVQAPYGVVIRAVWKFGVAPAEVTPPTRPRIDRAAA
ncbi:hypothetical protein GCM10027162_07520 [Streptomyces incanus]